VGKRGRARFGARGRRPAWYWRTWLLDKEKRLRFIVLRGGALGDLLLTVPVLQALRKSDLSSWIELIAPFPAALLAQFGGADSVRNLDSAAFLSLFSDDGALSEELEKKFSKTDCVLSYLSDRGGSIRAKIERSGCRFIPGPFRLNQHRIPATIQLIEPLRFLGLVDVDPVPRLVLSSKNRSNRLAFHVGSGSPAKNWFADRWAQLMAKLEERFAELILISGEADETPTAQFLAKYQSPKLKLKSNLPILDLAHELAVARFFIGHDSGISHLAAALGVPTVALFGPTDAVIWRPNGGHAEVVSSKTGCMDGLLLADVLAVVETAIGRSASWALCSRPMSRMGLMGPMRRMGPIGPM
jgi:heptosyltransferase-3